MRIDVITLFPAMINGVSAYGVCGRAIREGIVELVCWNPRDYTEDNYSTVDDRPYGGGPGMVMKVEPLNKTWAAVKAADPVETALVYLSPQGKSLDHQAVLALAARPRICLLAGRYEGIDQRFIDTHVDEEISLGDYVLSGGELAALVVIDALSRQLPGTLGHAESAADDSFADGLLDCPHYTRPENMDGSQVPPVLLSGDHRAIDRWRLKQALGRTWRLRPDLLRKRALSTQEKALLDEFIEEYNQRLES